MSDTEKSAYIRGDRVVVVKQGVGKDDVVDKLGIDSDQRRRRIK